jgi:hypothetical protein
MPLSVCWSRALNATLNITITTKTVINSIMESPPRES